MFYFNLEAAKIFQAVKWERHPFFKYARNLKRVSFYFFLFVFLFFLAGLLGQLFSDEILSSALGLSVISLVFWIFFRLQESFFNVKLKKPRLYPLDLNLQVKIIEGLIAKSEQYNLAEFLSFEIARAVSKSSNFTKSRKFSKVTSDHLFYFLLKDNPKLNFIFSRAMLNLNEVKAALKKELKTEKLSPEKETSGYSIDFQETIFESFRIAQKKGHQRVELGDMLTALSKYNQFFRRILIETKLVSQDIENLTWWLESLEKRSALAERFWEIENLKRKGSIARDWAAGYTVTLDRYSTDWTEVAKKRGFEEIIGHQDALEAIERVLARTEINNVLLIGEPGIGRKSIIHGLTLRVLYGQSLPELNYKRVVELDLTSLLSEITSLEEVEAVLDRIFKEVVRAGNIILVIDEFHNYIGQLARPGIIDISGALSSYLRLPSFRIIGITSFTGLHKYIEQNPSLLNLFGKIEASELSETETILILESLVPSFEKKYKKFISYLALRDIIVYASRYIQTVPFPKKAIDLLDEIMVYVSRYIKGKLILPEHIAKIVSEKTQIPVGEVAAREKEILLNLEKLIHQRIINQEEAVRAISEALRRARADITVRRGPMGTFLFLGPTGVGKTETSKALAATYFGSEKRMIRLDMSEFQAIEDISRLLGSAGEEGLLTTPVRENPFSLVLLDEIEKAHHNILNLFLQILDEGYVTDGLGRKVSFSNTIIIATSNAGYKIILEAIKTKTAWQGVKKELLDYLFAKGIFRPELVNRFDAMVIFRPLTRQNLLDISEILFSRLKKNLAKKYIEFII
ncbi:MAG TPA: ATP-dependent Clp protease ATP-binding subunit, partial [Candidatus Nealsonbacteria bacterium]|nr:ATP-dependent Clp protease ATP-binding subunit [Candidatus Nealsonbacteria bacterium]